MGYNFDYCCSYKKNEENDGLVDYQYDLLNIFNLQESLENEDPDDGSFEEITRILYEMYSTKLKSYAFMEEILKKKSNELLQEDAMTGLTLFYAYATMDIFHSLVITLYKLTDPEIQSLTREELERYEGQDKIHLEKIRDLLGKLNI